MQIIIDTHIFISLINEDGNLNKRIIEILEKLEIKNR